MSRSQSVDPQYAYFDRHVRLLLQAAQELTGVVVQDLVDIPMTLTIIPPSVPARHPHLPITLDLKPERRDDGRLHRASKTKQTPLPESSGAQRWTQMAVRRACVELWTKSHYCLKWSSRRTPTQRNGLCSCPMTGGRIHLRAMRCDEAGGHLISRFRRQSGQTSRKHQFSLGGSPLRMRIAGLQSQSETNRLASPSCHRTQSLRAVLDYPHPRISISLRRQAEGPRYHQHLNRARRAKRANGATTLKPRMNPIWISRRLQIFGQGDSQPGTLLPK